MHGYGQTNAERQAHNQNELVASAADVMEAKAIENDTICQIYIEEDRRSETVAKLRADNMRIREAIEIMRELSGCW